MVDFLGKRLQVFVSSTFTDLVEERQAAVEAILTAGHIPAGMELFTSGDESQMDVIKQWIDESDVYMLILGGRYGSVEPTSQKSYTQIEYEYAVTQDKPLFGCVVTDDAQERRVKQSGTSVFETEHPQKLKEFRSLVLSKLVRFWEDPKDIKIAIGETLSQFARREDLRGWIRPQHEADVPVLADEIARLSKENADLRRQLNQPNQSQSIQGLEFDELLRILKKQDLVDALLSSRDKLGGLVRDETTDLTSSQLNELCVLGLLEPMHEYMSGTYELSKDGRVFLNRLLLLESSGDD